MSQSKLYEAEYEDNRGRYYVVFIVSASTSQATEIASNTQVGSGAQLLSIRPSTQVGYAAITKA